MKEILQVENWMWKISTLKLDMQTKAHETKQLFHLISQVNHNAKVV